MKNPYKIVAVMMSLMLSAMVGYYYLSPKVIITNLSNQEYDEIVITLPNSRISYGPLVPQESNTVFYSLQNERGKVSYALIEEGIDVIHSEFLYEEGAELGRVLKFTIEKDGNLTVAF